LLTDFGLGDVFVGQMQGAILSRFPAARIVDSSHGVPAHDVAVGGFWLRASLRHFPTGTVHVAVVDPGVGTARRPLAAVADDCYFIGPDNGLLATALAAAQHRQVRAIDPAVLRVGTLSTTFHGRDLFAPAAAELACGRVGFPALGPVVEEWTPGVVPMATVRSGRVAGVVLFVDRFGNSISNVTRADLAAAGLIGEASVACGGLRAPLRRTYGDVDRGAPVAVINSFDVVEIGLREDNAALRHRIEPGQSFLVASGSASRG
jgi:S-adenosylmethionine hydrolase